MGSFKMFQSINKFRFYMQTKKGNFDGLEKWCFPTLYEIIKPLPLSVL